MAFLGTKMALLRPWGPLGTPWEGNFDQNGTKKMSEKGKKSPQKVILVPKSAILVPKSAILAPKSAFCT